MNNIRIISLTLENFKSIKKKTIDFQQHLVVRGGNHIGKTTIVDATFWTLFDRDSQNRGNNFGIATMDKDGNIIPRLHHKTTLVLDINGKRVCFSKDYHEKWIKRKGSTEEVFDGNTTDYAIDEIPVSKSEYVAKVNEIISDDRFRMLTDVLYFGRMDWKEQKRILREMTGDVRIPDATLLANELFDNLCAFLNQGHTIEEYDRFIKSRKNPITTRAKQIPSEIEGMEQTLPEDVNLADVDETVKQINEKRDGLIARRNALTQIIEDAASRIKTYDLDKDNKRCELEKIDADITMLRQQASLEATKKFNEENNRYVAYCAAVSELNNRKAGLQNQIKAQEKSLEDVKNLIEGLRKQYNEINAKEWQGETVCPTCHQELPAEVIEDAKARFAENKKAEIEKNISQGKRVKESIEIGEKTLAALRQQLAEANATVIEPVAQPQPAAQPDLSINKDYLVLTQKRAMLVEALNKSLAENANTDSTLNEHRERDKICDQILELDIQLKEQERRRGLADTKANTLKLIEAKKVELRECSTELTKLEREEQAIIDYKRLEVETIEAAVNSKFSLVRFRFYKPLVNGGYDETCECTMHGTPYASLSASEKVNAGLDIINALQKHFDMTAPIFIDNAEGVNDFIVTLAQTIKLYVSNDSDLVITEELL